MLWSQNATGVDVRFSLRDVADQTAALYALGENTVKSLSDPLVRRTAIEVVQQCPSRDDLCELQAIYRAVKEGDPRVEALKTGFKYVADPRSVDYFVSPRRNLEWCLGGACGGDCDDHAALISALAGSLGFKVGLRAWGNGTDFAGTQPVLSHVYAVVGVPKRNPTRVIGMDTTVKSAHVGWEPPTGVVKTAWIT